MISAQNADGPALTGDFNAAAAPIDLPVCVDPEGLRGLYGENGGLVGSDSAEPIVFSLEGGGQGKKDEKL